MPGMAWAERPTLARRVGYWYSAWSLKRVARWQHAATWSRAQVFWRITVTSTPSSLFWPLAIGLLLQAIAGHFRDPVDLLLVLLAMALGSIFLGLLFTAGWRTSLRWDLGRAEAYGAAD